MSQSPPTPPRPFDFAAVEDFLRCPKSHARLVMHDNSLVSCDPETRLCFEIRDGIPILLAEEAAVLALPEWREIMRQHGRDPDTGAAPPKD